MDHILAYEFKFFVLDQILFLGCDCICSHYMQRYINVSSMQL